jgi:hypothetical protein
MQYPYCYLKKKSYAKINIFAEKVLQRPKYDKILRCFKQKKTITQNKISLLEIIQIVPLK